MKSFTLFPVLFFLVACSSGTPEYDATGTFEATDVVVSAEASGKILGLDVEEGTVLKAGQEAGIIDTVQLYLKKLQLEAGVKSVEGQRPDILKQVAATKEQILQAQRERDRVGPVAARRDVGLDLRAALELLVEDRDVLVGAQAHRVGKARLADRAVVQALFRDGVEPVVRERQMLRLDQIAQAFGKVKKVDAVVAHR